MRQWLTFRSAQAGAATAFFPALGQSGQDTTEARATLPITSACVMSNLAISLRTAPGGATAYTYTIKQNGTATSLAVTITGAATSGSDTNPAHAVTFAAGDTCTLVRTRTGVPANGDLLYTIQLDTTTAGVSIYGTGCTNTLSNSVTRNNGVLYGQLTTQTNAGFGAPASVMPIGGTLTRMDIILDGAPGAGTSYAFTIYKALAATPTTFVKQDGSGGSVNTQLTIANTATTGSTTFSLSVSPGDCLYLEATPTGAPTARRNMCGYAFTATNDGESIICGNTDGAGGFASFSATVDNYMRPMSNTPTTTEANEEVSGAAAYTIGKLYAQLNASQGAGKSINLSVRLNLGTPSGTPSLTISGATDTTGHDTAGIVAITAGDTWDMRTSPPGGAGTARQAIWAVAQNPVPAGGNGIEAVSMHFGIGSDGAFGFGAL